MNELSQLSELSPPILLALALNLLGSFLKKSPIQDWLIPFVLIGVGAAVYPVIAEVGKVSFAVASPTAFNAVIGAVIGGASVGINQAFRQFTNRKDNQ